MGYMASKIKCSAILVFAISSTVISYGDTTAKSWQHGFEPGEVMWGGYTPPDNMGCRGHVSISKSAAHTGEYGAIVTSSGFGRFGLYPKTPAVPVQPGARYRMSIWLKAEPGFAMENNLSGAFLRVTLFDADKKDHAGGHIYIGLKGVSIGSADALGGVIVPDAWTHLQGVFEIPAGAQTMRPFLFIHRANGNLLVDDFAIELVDASTPLTNS